MFWFGAVGVPYLALFALAVVGGGRGRRETPARFLTELGVEACLVGLGITGALFASHEVSVKIGAEAGLLAGIFLLLDLVLCGICFRLRESEEWEKDHIAIACMFLGVLSLSLNTLIVMQCS